MTTERRALFAFVDPKDPFTPGEVAGEDRPGPILSVMAARRFDSAFLFHTPQTGENAETTRRELSRRHPACEVALRALPVWDPKDYSGLMGSLARLRLEERCAGVAFAIGGRLSGLDLFDHPATLEAFFPKLLRSYALDALDAAERCEPAERATALKFLARVGGAAATAEPAVGLGKDVRIAGASVSGAALWANGRYIHLCAFASHGDGAGARPATRMTRPSRRRTR